MYRLIVLPFLLQYLNNAENLICSWSVTSKPTSMILNNLLYYEFEMKIFDKMLYDVDSSNILRWLLRLVS
jgi:hypothetical protein